MVTSGMQLLINVQDAQEERMVQVRIQHIVPDVLKEPQLIVMEPLASYIVDPVRKHIYMQFRGWYMTRRMTEGTIYSNFFKIQ